MTNSYHVNPTTGNVYKCSASSIQDCPYKDNPHFDDKQHANIYAEKLSEVIANKEKMKKDFMKAYELYGDSIVPFTMTFPDDVNHLLKTLQSHGFKPLLAGGAVRDAVVNSENSGDAVINSKDLDFEIYADTSYRPDSGSDDTQRLIKAARKVGAVDEVGKSFGVLKMTLNDKTEIDLSLPRRESKNGSGHTGFDIQPDITMNPKEASARRDFTLNSMLYDNDLNVVIDSYHGLDDLKNKQLRHTSDAFAEDPLRVLRSFQFASRFGFSLNKDTVKLSQDLYSEYDTISSERVQTEWEKWASKGKKHSSGLKVLHDTGWDKGFAGLPGANNERMRAHVDNANIIAGRDSALDKKILLPATIAHHIKDKDERKKFVEQTVIGKNEQRKVLNLTHTMDTDYEGIAVDEISSLVSARQAAVEVNIPLRDRVALYKAIRVNKNMPDSQKRDLKNCHRVINQAGVWDEPEKSFLTGHDILNLTDKKPGPWLKDITHETKIAQARRKFSNHDEGIEYMKTLLRKRNLVE